MTESVLSNIHEPKSNRLDPPHDLLSSVSPDAPPAANDGSNSWMAYAGRDPKFTTQQVDRQAGELLAYVQEQNKEIDVRQAELNAKLAQLDNQLRNARLRSVDDSGTDLLAANEAASSCVDPMLDSGLDLHEYTQSEPDALAETSEASQATDSHQDAGDNSSNSGFAVADLGYVQEEVSVRVSHYHPAHQKTSPSEQEFEEVERLVAQFTDSDVAADTEGIEDLWNHDPDADLIDAAHETEAIVQDSTLESTAEAATENSPTLHHASKQPANATRENVDAFPEMLAGSHLRRVDSNHFSSTGPMGGDAAMESERRLLAERKLELERQKSILGRMEEETQALHREALEMRIVTEQLWAQLSNSTPPEQLSELISNLRDRLDQHYASEQSALENRKHELLSMQNLLESKQAGLRDQSSKLQDWFASRQDEIKTYANEIDAREMLLDRREHRLQDEFAKWEAQRKAYESQLQGLAQQLKLNGLPVK